jgi:hypothetical protein
MRSSSVRRTFALGAGIGVALSAGLVLTGRLDVFFTPLWQKVVFFPGFVAGWTVYDSCGGVLRAFPRAREWCQQYGWMLAGIAAVGLAYGLVAVGIRALMSRLTTDCLPNQHR